MTQLIERYLDENGKPAIDLLYNNNQTWDVVSFGTDDMRVMMNEEEARAYYKELVDKRK